VKNSLVGRMIGAAMLDVATYEEVEHDTSATTQAGLVVVLVAVAQGIASPAGVISGIVGSLIGWLAMAGLTYFIGTRLFKGTATWGELLRTLGFATAPGILYIVGIIPILGALASLAIMIWVLVAVVIAIRQALDVTTGKAVLTGLLGMIAWAVIVMAVPGL
jgi:hypothetical protein